MTGFCGSEFWDGNLTWTTNTPDFTPCFADTVLAWLPCLFLWIFGPLTVLHHAGPTWEKERMELHILSSSVLSKIATTLLIVLHIWILTWSLTRAPSEELFPVDVVTPAVTAATMALMLGLDVIHSWRGIHSTSVIFVFWGMAFICDTFRLQSRLRFYFQLSPYHIKVGSAPLTLRTHPWLFYAFCLSYLLTLAQLVLQFRSPPISHSDKYSRALKIGKDLIQLAKSPEKLSSVPSRWAVTWFYPILQQGMVKSGTVLQLSHLPDLDLSSRVRYCSERFLSMFNNKVRPGESISIWGYIWKAHWRVYLVTIALRILRDFSIVAMPILLDAIMSGYGKTEKWKNYMWAALLFVFGLGGATAQKNHFHLMALMQIRVKSCLTGLIYRKSLQASPSARIGLTTGDLVNLISVDVQRVAELFDPVENVNKVFNALILLGIPSYYLWRLLGPVAIACPAILLLSLPFSALFAVQSRKIHGEQMKEKDKRMSVLGEAVANIKILKLYAWELPWESRVRGHRSKEVLYLTRAAYWTAGLIVLLTTTPYIISLVMLAIYAMTNSASIPDPRTIFVSLAFINIMYMPMRSLPLFVAKLVQAGISIKRISGFLQKQETLESKAGPATETNGIAVSIKDGEFNWGDASCNFTLKGINLTVKQGALVAIVGKVGSGKSSLLSAILGDMDVDGGQVCTNGKLAYVSQSPWIQSMSVKDNIICFGPESGLFDSLKYEQVLEACALKFDVKTQLPAGDETEIGDRGTNLSGGQKQRISLARAVYSDADVYLLDDPLSALDPHVRKQVFQRVIGPEGLLHAKTRLMVTQSPSELREADMILELQDGGIVSVSCPAEYFAGKDESLVRSRDTLPETADVANVEQKFPPEDFPSVNNPAVSPCNGQGETTRSSGVSRGAKHSAYRYYFGLLPVLQVVAFVSFLLLGQGMFLAGRVWLHYWSLKGKDSGQKTGTFILIYAAFGIGQALFTFLGLALMGKCLIDAADSLHDGLLQRLFRACSYYFDLTPSGVLLDRFSRDLNTLEAALPFNAQLFQQILLYAVAAGALVCYAAPWFLLAVVPLVWIYVYLQGLYTKAFLQLCRLEAAYRSPLFSLLSESFLGAATIKAFSRVQKFIDQFEQLVDASQICYHASTTASRWIDIRLEALGHGTVLLATLLPLLTGSDAATLGLSVSSSFLLMSTVNNLFRAYSSMESDILAAERFRDTMDIPQEAAWDVPEKRPPDDWPSRGEITFRSFDARYKACDDLVLKGVSITIGSGEKVGLVGRTGSGKSSLGLALFRIFEAAAGSIEVDGQNISLLGLHEIRRRITIIPQDPVLFSGTVRLNLDPQECLPDETLWAALEKVNLGKLLASLPQGLSFEVSEGGRNFSLGQRQLLCIARALLRNTRVLVIDEATAAVDAETDCIIQRLIRTELADCTVLTIAHKTNTILDCDRIIVLQQGRILEYDSPAELLKDNSSHFHALIYG